MWYFVIPQWPLKADMRYLNSDMRYLNKKFIFEFQPQMKV